MELKQLTDHIFYTDGDFQNDRPLLGYILGDDYSVMIDAGNSQQHVADYHAAIAAHGYPKPRYCIITHWHWDHTFGMHALEAETIVQENANKELLRMSKWQWNDSAMRQRLADGEEIDFADEHIRVEYDDLESIKVVPAKRIWTEGMQFDCGGVTCECLHLPSPHSDDSLVILIPEEKVLFMGDIYNDDFYNNHERDTEKTKQLYDALNRIDFDITVPGHGGPVPKQFIMTYLETFI